MTGALVVSDLGVRLDARGPKRVEGIGFRVARGEVFGVAGVNGAGKSTLLRSVLNLLDVAEGRIEVLGLPHREAVARGLVSYLPERFVPPARLTGREFLTLVERMAGRERSPEQLDAHARTFLLDGGLLDLRCETLSKGTAQKLGLAAAFLGTPPLVVLDEPMSGLDPVARVRLRTVISEAKGRGTAVVFSSHLMADFETNCTQMILLDRGRAVFVGAPRALCDSVGAPDLEAAFALHIKGTS